MGIFGAQSSVLKRGAPHVAQGPTRGQKKLRKNQSGSPRGTFRRRLSG